MPKNGKVLLVALVTMLLLLTPSALAAGSGQTRQLEAVQVQAKNLQKKIHKSESVINFYQHKGRWALHISGTEHGKKKCWQVTGVKRRKVCSHARRTLAHHTHRLKRLERKLQSLMPWVHDVARTEEYRRCLISYESSRSGYGNYTAENGGTRGVEGPGNSDASGAYQFLDSTWQTMLRLAEAYYGLEISSTHHAADAEPWSQDVVAAFAIVVYHGSDWTHPRCRAIIVPA